MSVATPRKCIKYMYIKCINYTQDLHQTITFDPIKDGTLGAASPKTIGV